MTEKKLLTREEILSLDDRPTELVYVEEWGGWVRVRGMGAGERFDFLQEVRRPDGQVDAKALSIKAVLRYVVDEEGRPLFKEEDYDALCQKSPQAIDTIVAVWGRLSGIQPGAVAEARKNS